MKTLAIVLGFLLSLNLAVKSRDFSLFESELYEQQILQEIESFDREQIQQISVDKQVGGSVCQALKDFKVYDFKRLSLHGRAKKSSAVLKKDTTSLVFEVCSGKFEVNSEGHKASVANLDQASCKKMHTDAPGNMYVLKGGKCVQSFNKGAFKPTSNSTWTLTYTSLQKCKGKNSSFVVTVQGKCDKTKKRTSATKPTLTFTKVDQCAATVDFVSADACVLATLPLQKYLAQIGKFTGAILIIAGLIMTFYGSKFILQTIFFLAFVAGTGAVFMVGYNFLPPGTAKLWAILVVLAIAALAGAALGYFLYKIAGEWAAAILGGAVGVVTCMLVLKLAKVENQNIVLVACVVAALGGGALGRTYNTGIKQFGTAFVGAYLLIRGVATYAGGLPSEFSPANIKNVDISSLEKEQLGSKAAMFIYIYLAAFVIIGFLGFFVQRRLIPDPDKDDNYMDGEEEGRVCGCF